MSESVASILRSVRTHEKDIEFIASDDLNVRNRTRTSAFPWRGQFTPGLVEALLEKNDPEEGIVYDPFLGSGTTLSESMRRGRPSSGIELNPAAFVLTRIFEIGSQEQDVRKSLVRRARSVIDNSDPLRAGGLFDQQAFDESGLEEVDVSAPLMVPFSAPLSRLLHAVLLLAMGNSRTTNVERIRKSWRSVENLVLNLPGNPVPCSVELGDARKAKAVKDGSVGLTLTSPPYINVFNYHQNYRPAVEHLGWEVLAAARSEIGSNRKHRTNRFLTVIQYAQDMTMVFRDIVRASMDGAAIVMVVGRESRVMGVPFANSEILMSIGERIPQVAFVRIQERMFTNRYGQQITEDILTFKVNKKTWVQDEPNSELFGRELGVTFLEEQVSGAGESTSLVRGAIDGAGSVFPSAVAVPQAILDS